MPGATGLHIERALQQVSLKYRNGNYVADKIAPVVKVKNLSDLYYIYNRDNFRIPNALRADKSETRELDWGATTDRYTSDFYGFKGAVSDLERQNTDAPFQLDIDTTEFLTDCLHLNREYAVASYVLNSTTPDWQQFGMPYNTTHFANLLAGWDDRIGADPRSDIYYGKYIIWRDARVNPNNIFFPVEVCFRLAQMNQIDELRKYTDPGLMTDSNIPRKLWGLDVNECQTTYNAGVEGSTTAAFTETFGNNVLMTYTNPNILGQRSLTFAATFQPREFQTRRWREDWRECDVIEVTHVWGVKMVASACGFVYTNAITATT